MEPPPRKTGDEQPLACNLGAMDARQTERYRALRKRLEHPGEVRELDNGYAFGYTLQSGLLVALADYVSLERLCCPFFDFTIEVRRGGDEVSLEMTGPEGAKGILETARGDLPRPDGTGSGAGATTV